MTNIKSERGIISTNSVIRFDNLDEVMIPWKTQGMKACEIEHMTSPVFTKETEFII